MLLTRPPFADDCLFYPQGSILKNWQATHRCRGNRRPSSRPEDLSSLKVLHIDRLFHCDVFDRVLVQKIVYLVADRAQTFGHRKLAVQLECGGFNYLRRFVLAVVEDGKAAATQARVYTENAPTELLA